jgi:hypothetical protein
VYVHPAVMQYALDLVDAVRQRRIRQPISTRRLDDGARLRPAMVVGRDHVPR